MRIDVVVLAAGIVAACFLIQARPRCPRAAIIWALILTVVIVRGPRLIRSRLLAILDLR